MALRVSMLVGALAVPYAVGLRLTRRAAIVQITAAGCATATAARAADVRSRPARSGSLNVKAHVQNKSYRTASSEATPRDADRTKRHSLPLREESWKKKTSQSILRTISRAGFLYFLRCEVPTHGATSTREVPTMLLNNDSDLDDV